jgi:hypothetical protein
MKVNLLRFSSSLAGNGDRMAKSNGNGRSSEVDRYRQAATDALEMLDWCIGYLVGCHKDAIASRLARNRRDIKERLMHESAEPVPTTKD